MTTSSQAFLVLAGLSAGAALVAAPAAEAGDFSGTRLEAHAGYMWSKESVSGFAGAGNKALSGYDSNGSAVGATVTHDWQCDTTVYGIYASATSVEGKGGVTRPLTVTDMEGTTLEHHGFDTDLTLLASVGGRIGKVVNDNTLVYAQAGIASGKLKIVETGDDATAVRKVSQSGYAVGAGVDLQLNDKWSVGVNWTHYELGKADFTPTAYGPGKIGVKADVATIGLSFKF